ncbi:unnamed protein product [Urochloa decumbens]|uniref:Uncharacterized protein n=1 Tax=Urochloa decumbens TaxID=240449 RepID=A0ABC9ENC7_9POAL
MTATSRQPPSAKLPRLRPLHKRTPAPGGRLGAACGVLQPFDRAHAMDQLLALLVLLAAASCFNVAASEEPWPAAALAAYSLWILASAALAVLLPRRRPE